MSKGGAAPQVPNWQDLAKLQGETNRNTAIDNATIGNVNSRTPFGNSTWTQTPGVNGAAPTWTNTQTLSPGQQTLANSQTALGQSMVGQAGRSLQNLAPAGTVPNAQNYNGGPNLDTSIPDAGRVQRAYNSGGDIRSEARASPQIGYGYNSGGAIDRDITGAGNIQRNLGPDDFSADRQRVEDALMGRLNTQSDRDWQSRSTQLVNQGVREGSDAWTRAESDFNKNRSENRTNALLSAGTEQNRMQQLALNSGNFANSAQGQLYGQNANDAAFANSAQAQANAQNQGAAAFHNQAQGAQYGQNANDLAAYNSAQAQREGQLAARAGFGNAAQNQLFGQNLAGTQFGNQALQQQWANQNTAIAGNNQNAQTRFGNQNTLRNQGLNEVNALRGGGQIMQPQFTQGGQPQMPTTDVAGLASQQYGQQFNQWQQQQNANNSMWGGLMGAGANLLTLSDKRAKKDITPVGKTNDGQPLYSYKYRSGGPTQIGLLAQDVQKRRPDAVHEVETPRGMLLMVDYSKALEHAA